MYIHSQSFVAIAMSTEGELSGSIAWPTANKRLLIPGHPVNFGILAPVVAKPGKDVDLTDFLQTGYNLSLGEAETVQWFAIKYADTEPSTYAIFDTFAAPAGRAAHLSGPIAAALMANAPNLLSQPPEIGEVDILASIVDLKKGAGGEGRTAGLSVGLRVLFEAKEDKIQTVKEFLIVSHLVSVRRLHLS